MNALPSQIRKSLQFIVQFQFFLIKSYFMTFCLGTKSQHRPSLAWTGPQKQFSVLRKLFFRFQNISIIISIENSLVLKSEVQMILQICMDFHSENFRRIQIYHANLKSGIDASGEPMMWFWKVGDTNMSLSFSSPLNPVANMTKSDSRGEASPSTTMPSLQKLNLGAFFRMMLPFSTLS